MEHEHSHHHHFEIKKGAEKRTLIVILLTAITMVAEILTGYFSNSMALLADGWHMGTHALALSVTFFAYVFIRKIQDFEYADTVSEKISALAGYTSSLFLLLTALWLIYESFDRLLHPLSISFNEAILVAVIGLVVNIVCVTVLEGKHTHIEHSANTDYNYKAAYLHILTDALTSVFAIVALLAGKYIGLYFVDPIMGFVGAALILNWSCGLIKNTSEILLDLKLLGKTK